MRVSALALLLAACHGGAGEAPKTGASAPVPVKVEALAPAPLERAVEATGTVEAFDTAEIRPEVQGLVEAVLFDDGASVRKGQALVRLRSADAKAALLDAQARATLAGAALDRAKALFDRGDVAKADLDKATADDQLARAAVAKAEEAVRRTTVAAPFDGVVGRRGVSPGELIDPSRTITRIEALDRLVVDVALAEGEVADVADGQAAVVTAEALPDTHLDGTVSFVAPRVAADTRTVAVRVALKEPGPLRPGMTASVHIVTAKVPDALLVPSEAVVRAARGTSLYVVGTDGTAALKPVRTGDRQGGRVEVVEGLAAGDAVVVEGLARLRPGAKVEVVQPAAPTTEGGSK